MVRLPAFSCSGIDLSDEYSGHECIEKVFNNSKNFYYLAFFARSEYTYMVDVFMNASSDSALFVFIALRSLCNSMIMDVMRIYDVDSDSLDIRTFLNSCRKTYRIGGLPRDDMLVFSEIDKHIAATSDLFRTYDSVIRNLIKLRNKMYAHNDSSYAFDYDALLEKHGIGFEEMWRLIDVAGDTCARILSVITPADHEKLWSGYAFSRFLIDSDLLRETLPFFTSAEAKQRFYHVTHHPYVSAHHPGMDVDVNVQSKTVDYKKTVITLNEEIR